MFNSIFDAYFWLKKYLFTQHMDVNNVSNILRHKPSPVGVFPIGVATSSQLVVAVEASGHNVGKS